MQNVVVDLLKSTSLEPGSPGIALRNYPGELRFLGAIADLQTHDTPLDTAFDHFTPDFSWPSVGSAVFSGVMVCGYMRDANGRSCCPFPKRRASYCLGKAAMCQA